MVPNDGAAAPRRHSTVTGRMRRGFWLGLLALGGVAAAAAIMTRRPDAPPRAVEPAAAALTAEVVRARLVTVAGRGAAPGVVIAAQSATLTSKATGRIAAILVREGDTVAAGRMLVRLDRTELAAGLARAEAEHANAARRLERVRALQAAGAASEEHLDEAERALRVAEADRAALAAALAETEVAAPFAGVVTARLAELGELAAPGTPLLTIESHRLQLEAAVPAAASGRLRVGQELSVEIDLDQPLGLTARLARIIPAADPATHSVTIKLDLPGRAELRSGLYGRAFYPGADRSSVLAPAEAVGRTDGLARVWAVADDGRVRARLVRVGAAHGDAIEILAGLDPNERLLRRWADGHDGARVEPAP